MHLLQYGPSGSQSSRRVFLRIKDRAKTVKKFIQQVRVLLKYDPAKSDHRKVVKK